MTIRWSRLIFAVLLLGLGRNNLSNFVDLMDKNKNDGQEI